MIRNWILEMAHSRSLLDIQLEMLNRQLEFRGVMQVGDSHVGFLSVYDIKDARLQENPGAWEWMGKRRGLSTEPWATQVFRAQVTRRNQQKLRRYGQKGGRTVAIMLCKAKGIF